MATGQARRRSLVAAALLTVGLTAPPGAFAGPGATTPWATSEAAPDGAQPELAVYRVGIGPGGAEELAAAGFDLVESRGPDHVLVVGDATVAAALQARGLAVAVDQPLAPLAAAPARPTGGFAASVGAGPFLPATATFNGGYHTVDAHQAHLRAVAAAHPDLAAVIRYGQSWRQARGRAGGRDLLAICLTRRQPGDCTPTPGPGKPRAVILAAVHARELQTAELARNLIDDLVNGYGTDAQTTLLLDTTEVWVVPVANPDGRTIVEAGGTAPYLQRKNADDDLGRCADPPTPFDQAGVDLNRNAAWHWGGIGTSADPCDQTYPGAGPASEPEQQGLQKLLTGLFGLQRDGADPNGPVPAGTRGTLVSLHSYGELVLLPPGDRGLTPDDPALRSLAFRVSHFNRYATGTGPEILYGTTGSIDDWAYGRLGVAALTIEVSPASGPCSGFTPDVSCIASALWPLNRPALRYLIGAAGAPFDTPLGPTVTSAAVPPGTVPAGTPVPVGAVIDGDAFGRAAGSVGRPRPEPVTAAEWYLDARPDTGGTPRPLTLSPTPSTVTVTARATVDTTSLTPGRHTLYLRGRSASGRWGPLQATTLTITSPDP